MEGGKAPHNGVGGGHRVNDAPCNALDGEEALHRYAKGVSADVGGRHHELHGQVVVLVECKGP